VVSFQNTHSEGVPRSLSAPGYSAARRYIPKFSKFYNRRSSIQPSTFHDSTVPRVGHALKHRDIELSLLTDANMYLMIESAMHVGIATISNIHAKVNNPHVQGYDPTKPTQYIAYLNANNLYGAVQSELLPVEGFNFLSADEVAAFDVISVVPDSRLGYILEFDLMYPSHLHDTHSDYPMAPSIG